MLNRPQLVHNDVLGCFIDAVEPIHQMDEMDTAVFSWNDQVTQFTANHL